MSHERISRATPDSNLVGRECVYCHREITAGEEVVICPRCKTVHHVECWKNNWGCARRGCKQVAKTVVPASEEADARKRLGDNYYLEKEKPKRKWKIALGVVAAMVIIALLGYQGPDPAAGRKKITLMVQGGYLEIEFYERVAKEFNEAHPEWYLEAIVTPQAGYEQKLVVMIGARSAPDIFVTDTDRYSLFAAEGVLLALDDYLSSSPEMVARLFPHGIEPYRIDGKVYGIPHPYAREIFSIFTLVDDPDIAWTVLVEILDAIEKNYPEKLRSAHDTEPLFPLFPSEQEEKLPETVAY